MKIEIGPCTVELVRGDITRQETDAVVNAANSQLAGGGGVDGAIHAAGGPAIMDETRRRYPGGCPTGQAVITGSGELAARFVIHAVGPVWRRGFAEEPQQLAGAYRHCLELAVDNQCRSLAFPSLSTGAYGYPPDQAAPVALETVAEFLRAREKPELIRFVLFDRDTYEAYSSALENLQI